MRTRIYNARILTMEEKRPVFKGEIYIDGGKIFRIKEAKTEKSERTEKPALNEEEKWDEEIDAEGNLIMPGFKNAHTHSAMTFLRSYADDMKLQEWLFDKVFPAEAKLTSDDVYHLTKLAILEYLTSGITAAFDMYKLKQDSAKAAEELGFRMVFCGDINDFGGTLEEMEQDYFRYQCEETPLLSYQFGFHAEYTTSRNLMEGIAQLAGKYKKPVYVHCSETKREVEECREKTGMTPIAYMDSLGLFENGGGLFHGVHLDEADFDIMKKKKICVVTNPASNLKLASGIAPIGQMLQKGIVLGLGTDGASSNNNLDMLEEVRLASMLSKVKEDNPRSVPAKTAIKCGTLEGAKAIGFDEVGAVTTGYKADLVLYDLKEPEWFPRNDRYSLLCNAASSHSVSHVFVDGKLLYENGEYLTLDYEKVCAEAQRCAERLSRA